MSSFLEDNARVAFNFNLGNLTAATVLSAHRVVDEAMTTTALLAIGDFTQEDVAAIQQAGSDFEIACAKYRHKVFEVTTAVRRRSRK